MIVFRVVSIYDSSGNLLGRKTIYCDGNSKYYIHTQRGYKSIEKRTTGKWVLSV